MKRIILILVFSVSFSNYPQWSGDPAVNNPICIVAGKQFRPQVVSDGTGGSIIVWWDYRSGATSDIYAQRIDSAGILQWATNGVAICTAINDQDYVKLVSDGAGGAIITWHDLRGTTSDIYAQRINGAGVPQWSQNGVAICTDLGYQSPPFITSDNANGAIIAWFDERNIIGVGDVYAQRISAAGIVQWATNGVAITSDSSNQGSVMVITSDGANGAIIAWGDNRNGGNNPDIYSQRISEAGVTLWTGGGIAICTATDTQFPSSITTDGSNGAIIAWPDRRIGGIVNFDIYSQRVTAAGSVQWTVNGVAICTAPNGQYRVPNIISDGSGGAILAWGDKRSSFYNGNIFIQRINAAGVVQWNPDGVAICTDSSDQVAPSIISDGANGAIIVWTDSRTGPSNNQNIYAQRINNAGVPQWTTDGIAICTAPFGQSLESGQMTNDSDNGAIIGWYDTRNGGFLDSSDIYCQRVRGNGVLGGTTDVNEWFLPEGFSLYQNYPNPFNPTTKIGFRIANSGFVTLKVFDLLGKEVATLVSVYKPRGNYEIEFNSANLKSGVYFYQLQLGNFIETRKMILMK